MGQLTFSMLHPSGSHGCHPSQTRVCNKEASSSLRGRTCSFLIMTPVRVLMQTWRMFYRPQLSNRDMNSTLFITQQEFDASTWLKERCSLARRCAWCSVTMSLDNIREPVFASQPLIANRLHHFSKRF